MKSSFKFLVLLLFLAACGKTTKNEQPVAENPNQELYKQVMEVHDEIMPKMEVIYNLQTGLEDKIENTANIGFAREKELEQVILNLDSASGSMKSWMQNFDPQTDSADQAKSRDYLLSELEKVKQVRDFVTQNITQAELELNKKEVILGKKTSPAPKNSGKEKEPTPVVVVKPTPVIEKPKVDPIVTQPVVKELPKKDSVVSKPKTVAKADSSTTKPTVVKPLEKKPDGKPFYFKLVNAESGNKVSGEVHIVEAKATQYLGVKGNELVYLTKPKNAAGVYQVAIQAPGYRPAKLVFTYDDPLAVSSGVGEQQETIITFELSLAKKLVLDPSVTMSRDSVPLQ